MKKPKIYADFHNADQQGRLRLNCAGTIQDLNKQQIHLEEGLLLTVYADDADDEGQLDELCADGIVRYNSEEKCWVAEIDWNALWHSSDHAPSGLSNVK